MIGRLFGQISSRGQCQWGWLADGDYMRVAAKIFQEINQIKREIFYIELALGNRNVARIVPVCYENVAIWQ